jgi:predicted metal-dependent hydrolase
MKVDNLLRSRRKTIVLYVRSDGSLEVRAPLRLSMAAIQAFVDSKTDWIMHQREKLLSRSTSDQRVGYAKGDFIWFLGQVLQLDFAANNLRQLKIEGHRLAIPVEMQTNLESPLIAWYRAQARQIITARVEFFSKRYRIQQKGIRITSARSRWGSCSANNHLNFPYRLVMAPLDIIDYVVVHELVHTMVHNHGKGFWSKVSEILPDYRLRRKWLKVNGHLFDLNRVANPSQIVPVQTKTRR